MPIGKNFIAAALIAAAIIFVSGFAGLADTMFILCNTALVLLWVYDMIKTPKPGSVEATRQLELKLSLAAENEVTIVLRNTSDYLLKISVTDDVPFYFRHNLPMKPRIVPAHGSAEYTYLITPLKRGEFLFPRIHIRYPGILGFCRKKGFIQTGELYKVYPNIKALSQYSIESLNKNIFVQGLRKTRSVSTGGEFESLREYSQGDDIRKINWPATARNNSLIVNTYNPERNQLIYLFVDSSRVMNTEIHDIKKLDYAINSAFLLSGHIIKKSGDNVGLMVFDNTVKKFLKPGKGPSQFDLIAENLYNIETSENSASYSEAICYFKSQQKKRSLIFIFTELFNTDEAVRFAEAVRSQLSGHMVFTITIKDPRLEEMADIKASSNHDLFIKSAALKILDERRKIRQVLSSASILNTDISPDKLSIEVLARYTDIKKSGTL